MLKIVKHYEDRAILGFGLSEENIKRLQEGQPIHFQGEQMGLLKKDILIFAGKDEEDLKKQATDSFGKFDEEINYK